MPSGISTRAPEARSSCTKLLMTQATPTPILAEINQQIHAGDIDGIVNNDMILLQIIVDVLARHVVLV